MNGMIESGAIQDKRERGWGRHEDEDEPQEEHNHEPSRNAIECVAYLLGEMQLWNGLARWWEDMSQGDRFRFICGLQRAWDKWDNGR